MIKYVPDPIGMAALARSIEVEAGLRAKAESAAAVARSIAPFEEGDYKDSIGADSGLGDHGTVIATVYASDWKSVFLELGTGEPLPTPAFATLRRAADTI
jgi:hypothetical protein